MNTPAIILIVDDVAANRETLRELFAAENYRLLEAADGLAALQLAAETPPDLVLLDVMMPGMDGYEVCRRLRADARLAEVPVIMVTAFDDQAARLAGLEAGADDFITKPFNRVELRARVRTITRLNRYRRLTEMQEQLLHAQRLENLGMLAAGIAHDFNNALAPILMAGSLLRPHVSDPNGQRLLGIMAGGAERSVALVRQLLSFARGASGHYHLLQTRHVLNEVIELAEATFPKSIRVESDLPGNLWPVQGSPTQIHQIFLNLCVNARDAMPEGGELTLTAANCRLDVAAAAEIPDARPGVFLAIEVRDTGTGIPPEVLARMWEPFYTTKGEGKGTGLGLSTVRGIVHQHAGFVTVQTQAGHGTAFTVYLPATVDGETGGAAAAPAELPRGNGELILVVDDEELVCELTAQTLIGHGYRAVTAIDGADAIAVFAPQAAQVRLLLTDLYMPVLGGAALARALRRLQPDLRIIAMSGAGSAPKAAACELMSAFLAKPFQPGTLLPLIHRVLHEPAPPTAPRPAMASGAEPVMTAVVP
jgi:two-component system cell cycle sensor histidine kinase/response regulator CckA